MTRSLNSVEKKHVKHFIEKERLKAVFISLGFSLLAVVIFFLPDFVEVKELWLKTTITLASIIVFFMAIVSLKKLFNVKFPLVVTTIEGGYRWVETNEKYRKRIEELKAKYPGKVNSPVPIPEYVQYIGEYKLDLPAGWEINNFGGKAIEAEGVVYSIKTLRGKTQLCCIVLTMGNEFSISDDEKN